MQAEGCYLYPVKGMTPAAVETLLLEPNKSPTGDRGFVFAYADAETHGSKRWVTKYDTLTSLSTPSLAKVRARVCFFSDRTFSCLQHTGLVF